MIHFLTGPLAGKMIYLQKPVTTIGRDRQNDIVVPDPTVSRYHARIRWLDDGWVIENLSQHSSLSLENQRVQQGNLDHQNQVKLGANVHFTFLLSQAGAQARPSSIPLQEIPEQKTVSLPPQAQTQASSTQPQNTTGAKTAFATPHP
jgi:pSer/pThr/pTyr-binding forkhead associated (FHA) protein